MITDLNMKRFVLIFLEIIPVFVFGQIVHRITNPEEYVSPLVGSYSKVDLSNGNTYPAIAIPWGMNFWTPQTGKAGDGFIYVYNADKIRGFKQTHQASNWINDYGQFTIPVPGIIAN